MVPANNNHAYSRRGIGGAGNYRRDPASGPFISTPDILATGIPCQQKCYSRRGIGGAGNIFLRDSQMAGGDAYFVSKAEQLERDRIISGKGGQRSFRGIGGKGNWLTNAVPTGNDSVSTDTAVTQEGRISTEPLPYTAMEKLRKALRKHKSVLSVSQIPAKDSVSLDSGEKKTGLGKTFSRRNH